MSDIPRPPAHLKPATRAWFTKVATAYELEAHHIDLLVLAAEARDRAELARQSLERHGLTFVDDKGRPKSRPEVQIVSAAAITYARLIRELRLDSGVNDELERIPRMITIRGRRTKAPGT